MMEWEPEYCTKCRQTFEPNVEEQMDCFILRCANCNVVIDIAIKDDDDLLPMPRGTDFHDDE